MPIYKILRPILFLLPPEFAHKMTLMALNLFGRMAPLPGKDDYILKQDLLGHQFSNPFGLAAGFDKNAEAIDGILKSGFGFTEVGTVTPLPQSGNDKPRVFRLKKSEAIINRLGFNNQGHEAVRARLSRRAPVGLVGVNIGANKQAHDRIADYTLGAEVFGDYASYLTVNVSSPNTPGLRDLQARKPLTELLKKVKKSARATPVLLKIAPDLDDAQLEDIAACALATKIDGIIISNTTLDRDAIAGEKHAAKEGGLSGRPLMAPATQILSAMRRLTKGQILLIGAGGVSSAADAYTKIRAGANLVQLYTAMVYQGPRLVENMKRDLAELLRADGFQNISEAVGVDVPLKQAVKKKPAKTAKSAAKKPAVKKQKGERKMTTTIYHNPRCTKSRQTLALLEEKGESVKIVEYLKEPLSADEIAKLVKKLKIEPASLLRKGEAVYKELKLKEVIDSQKLIQAMADNPILIERPIVVKGRKAALGRPPENVLEIL